MSILLGINEILSNFLSNETVKLGLDPDDLESIGEQDMEIIVENSFRQTSELLRENLRNSASNMLEKKRSEQKEFETKNYDKWCDGFDLLETLIVITEEIGSQYNDEHRPRAVAESDYVFEALITLHARMILTAKEILSLMKSGFADGAQARWRSLHEVAVTAAFIRKHGLKVALRYLRSYRVQSYKAIKQCNEYAKRADLEPFSDEEVKSSRLEYENIIKEYGEEMKTDYGWATSALNIKSPRLFDLEKSTGLDHWRPRYKWATHYIHPNYKPPSTYLGMVGTIEEGLIVGPSDAGFVDPAHQTAITLNIGTGALLHPHMRNDYLVLLPILTAISDEIGSVFSSVHRRDSNTATSSN
jgi:hypothetical protein